LQARKKKLTPETNFTQPIEAGRLQVVL